MPRTKPGRKHAPAAGGAAGAADASPAAEGSPAAAAAASMSSYLELTPLMVVETARYSPVPTGTRTFGSKRASNGAGMSSVADAGDAFRLDSEPIRTVTRMHTQAIAPRHPSNAHAAALTASALAFPLGSTAAFAAASQAAKGARTSSRRTNSNVPDIFASDEEETEAPATQDSRSTPTASQRSRRVAQPARRQIFPDTPEEQPADAERPHSPVPTAARGGKKGRGAKAKAEKGAAAAIADNKPSRKAKGKGKAAQTRKGAATTEEDATEEEIDLTVSQPSAVPSAAAASAAASSNNDVAADVARAERLHMAAQYSLSKLDIKHAKGRQALEAQLEDAKAQLRDQLRAVTDLRAHLQDQELRINGLEGSLAFSEQQVTPSNHTWERISVLVRGPFFRHSLGPGGGPLLLMSLSRSFLFFFCCLFVRGPNKVVDLHSQLEASESKRASLSSSNRDLTAENERLKKQVRARDTDLARMRRSYANLEADFAAAEQGWMEHEARLQAQEARFQASLKREQERLAEEQAALERTQQAARAQLAQDRDALRAETRALELKRERWNRKWRANQHLALKPAIDEAALQHAADAEEVGDHVRAQIRADAAFRRQEEERAARVARATAVMGGEFKMREPEEEEQEDEGIVAAEAAAESKSQGRLDRGRARARPSGLPALPLPLMSTPPVERRLSMTSQSSSAKKKATSRGDISAAASVSVVVAHSASASSLERLPTPPHSRSVTPLRNGDNGAAAGGAAEEKTAPAEAERTPKQFAVHTKHSSGTKTSGSKKRPSKRARSPSPAPAAAAAARSPIVAASASSPSLAPVAAVPASTAAAASGPAPAKRMRVVAPLSLSQPAPVPIASPTSPPAVAPRKVVTRVVKRRPA